MNVSSHAKTIQTIQANLKRDLAVLRKKHLRELEELLNKQEQEQLQRLRKQ